MDESRRSLFLNLVRRNTVSSHKVNKFKKQIKKYVAKLDCTILIAFWYWEFVPLIQLSLVSFTAGHPFGRTFSFFSWAWKSQRNLIFFHGCLLRAKSLQGGGKIYKQSSVLLYFSSNKRGGPQIALSVSFSLLHGLKKLANFVVGHKDHWPRQLLFFYPRGIADLNFLIFRSGSEASSHSKRLVSCFLLYCKHAGLILFSLLLLLLLFHVISLLFSSSSPFSFTASLTSVQFERIRSEFIQSCSCSTYWTYVSVQLSMPSLCFPPKNTHLSMPPLNSACQNQRFISSFFSFLCVY